MVQFTQPVSMQVTQEQYDKNLKKPLKLLGYKSDGYVSFNDLCDFYICTNFCKRNDTLAVMDKISANNANRYFINHYNPELFLAIAAMTKEKTWIVGEYLNYLGNIFKVTSLNEKTNDYKLGHARNESATSYTKPTKEEIINSFSKKESIMSKVDRTISIKCANQEEFDAVVLWLKINNEEIMSSCHFSNEIYPYIYYYDNGDYYKGWSSRTYGDNLKTPQELGIILNTPLNKPTMQNYLTRAELLNLYKDFNCTTFRNAIEEILRSNVVADASTLFLISENAIEKLKKDGTLPQKEAVSKLGIVLIEDKSVDTKNTLISFMINNRDYGEYQNKAFYLSYEYIWEIKKDIQGLLCLIPTKK